ncbi:FCS-Like Zinc finger 2-like [Hibiscus syriacus]|uniref:FCS-Like Zinc finger 2-like n=1 Tax=Hibiscus syriacus TaxID=106335 RepID=UPI00192083F4|nr:FCS-Like Zinc finger 2-like [Hibiscus syriacus]
MVQSRLTLLVVAELFGIVLSSFDVLLVCSDFSIFRVYEKEKEKHCLTGRSRGHCFIEEDQGLAYVAVMEVGNSGTDYQTRNQNEFSQRPLCYSRKISLKNPSSYPSSCSSPRSARFEDCNQPNFLDVCFICKEPLGGNEDLFMYREGISFCSEECRQGQLDIEETMEKSNSLPSSMKAQEIPPNC